MDFRLKITSFPGEDIERLRRAKALLENPSFAAKLTNLIGVPVEKGLSFLPERWSELVVKNTRASLSKALDFAVLTLGDRPGNRPFTRAHKLVVASTGAVGGAFGLFSLPVELPISVMIMLRSIADIARSHGEDVRLVQTRLSCVEVFALGGPTARDDATETGYFAVRTALARTVSEAATFLAQKGLTDRGAPALVRLIASIGSRFSLTVTEKVATQAVPIVGAAGGALVNALFMDHFQAMAEGHFTIRQLERTYGADEVRRRYEELGPADE